MTLTDNKIFANKILKADTEKKAQKLIREISIELKRLIDISYENGSVNGKNQIKAELRDLIGAEPIKEDY